MHNESSDGFIKFGIRYQNGVLAALNDLEEEIGVVNKKVANILGPLLQRSSLDLSAYANIESWSSITKNSENQILLVTILICGMYSNAPEIGQFLSKNNLYLQPPQEEWLRYPFINPQDLILPSHLVPQEDEQEDVENIATKQIRNCDSLNIAGSMYEIDYLLDHLPPTECLEGYKQDDRIKTKLLK
jgi:hypothetical protein